MTKSKEQIESDIEYKKRWIRELKAETQLAIWELEDLERELERVKFPVKVVECPVEDYEAKFKTAKVIYEEGN